MVWINGPFPAGRPDAVIYKQDGLSSLIPDGKKVIADKGYRGQKNVTITNGLDTEEVRAFKSHACSCHESFKKSLKTLEL